MKKTQVAFQMSAERLAERGRLCFWTFTFAQTLDIAKTRRRWNHLLTLMRRHWPKMCGLRVFEMHDTHGLHVHLLTDRFLDVNAARSMARRAGCGRIHVQRIPATKAGYLGKYLSKERPPCLKGWRLWAAFGTDWSWTKLGHLEKDSAFTRVYQYFKETRGWNGNREFRFRTNAVREAIAQQIRRATKPGYDSPVRQVILGAGQAVLS